MHNCAAATSITTRYNLATVRHSLETAPLAWRMLHVVLSPTVCLTVMTTQHYLCLSYSSIYVVVVVVVVAAAAAAAAAAVAAVAD